MGLGRTKAVPTLAVTDLKTARRFYSEVLGLEEVSELGEEGAAMFRSSGDSYLLLYERSTPSGSTATACSFAVEDVEATVDGLRSAGVKLEDYDIPEMGIQTRNGIATMGDIKSAWFKDPSGNILAIDNSLSQLEQRARDRRTGARSEDLHA
ncbi:MULTISPECIES: VOC family protein [unclassified Myxococcus]|uniref:VOC family protein n=1 Tax=unclassified Myxococcus TaxID=2648731 RepID=UPI00157A43F9|nr:MULTISPECIES: VOC family protein [unclassified Myxococcus]NTX01120.1 VOC family protein [Myxococcus sp. CA040A]NTX54407.1 VOC family protein [Myxococcus sp. CA039A]